MIIVQSPLGIHILPDDADVQHERARITMQLYDRYTEEQLEVIYTHQDRQALEALAGEARKK